MQRKITRWALVGLSLTGTVLAQSRTVATLQTPPAADPAAHVAIATAAHLPDRPPTLFNKYLGAAEARAVQASKAAIPSSAIDNKLKALDEQLHDRGL